MTYIKKMAQLNQLSIRLTVLLGCTILFLVTGCVHKWQEYPYSPEGTRIIFPDDEGSHLDDPTTKMEWWYTNFFLTAPETGEHYAVMICFFKPIMGHSLRLFNISSSGSDKMLTATRAGKLKSQKGFLDITHKNKYGSDRFYVKKDANGDLIPFNYCLKAHGGDFMISLEMESIKPPFIVGQDGYIQVGNCGNSWYYSLTRMRVNGTLKIGERILDVRGIGWMDHQWGPFLVSPVTTLFPTDSYEWFSIQLDNGEEYMVSNIFNSNKKLLKLEGFGGIGWMLPDFSSGHTVDFSLDRLAFWKAPTSEYYSAKWRVREPTRRVDLILTPEIQNQLVPLPTTFLGKFYFWEGVCEVEGTVQGKKVKGKAFAELVHRFKVPVLSIKLPLEQNTLKGKAKISWTVKNKDDGNPLTFSLFYRQNNGEYKRIADKLTSDHYYWDTRSQKNGDGYMIKLVAVSRDGTISGQKVSRRFSIQN